MTETRRNRRNKSTNYIARFARKCCKMRLFVIFWKLCADVCYSSSHCFTFCNFLRVFQLLQRTCHVLVTQYSMLMIWTLFSSVVHMGKTRWIDTESEWETPQKLMKFGIRKKIGHSTRFLIRVLEFCAIFGAKIQIEKLSNMVQ